MSLLHRSLLLVRGVGRGGGDTFVVCPLQSRRLFVRGVEDDAFLLLLLLLLLLYLFVFIVDFLSLVD